ncbi:hypothetical protein JQV19_05595 [Sulfitobacter mediterraneus]|uniref:alpha/beta hydrolase family protein n=1 Tax=Sulfitobacter mediterraneus TaxID=83219 RepID=UPI001939B024|nr:alpha/beta fold hydrolase [Sulfitobacter mediterraneus]MBM1556121.1 hypothetical protein [Sulfitobacter mediterraneus]MBM1567841.1 hypothetical protein [Sulfitobacter mediterraneus]MBM1571475.1 hypothetical protein [Sulfitobacter mediterraneus]MBM1575263.1 hypothetical protein [Sulfitobacter mediterraneus]MBM1579246.1 hypothetical protein [Sulfitobacter mediterraneus]
MKNLFHITALSFSLCAGAVYADDQQTGLAELHVSDSRSDRPLGGFIWYPTAQTGSTETVHTNAVWQGIDVIKDAAPEAGKHPFVVLSHGMYGNAMNQTWLADALVGEGYIVAAISHPGTSTWLRDADHARALWDRPGDISRVIDHALTDPEISPFIDAGRIYMAGHSLGGFTAVALAGGRFDPAAFDAFCASDAADIGCKALANWNVAQSDDDRIEMAQDLSDPRIKAFAVYDLGGTQTFSAGSLAAIERPMLVMGAPVDIAGMNLDTESRALSTLLPPAKVTYMEPETLSHFDFMGICKPAGFEILQTEEPGDEIICRDGGAARAQDHAMIVKATVAQFQ